MLYKIKVNFSNIFNINNNNTNNFYDNNNIELLGVIRHTGENTEVAVFSFNSIYLGPDTEVIVVGQRALALVSKTSAIINTTFKVQPGTLGGFPGGNSVARLTFQALEDHPTDIAICELRRYCLDKNGSFTSTITLDESKGLISNNVNGPGSGNLRVHPFIMQITAKDIDEVQIIRTFAREGQTLAGGFIVYFGGYQTPIIPFDASARMMKDMLEENLNLVLPKDLPIQHVRTSNRKAGIGLINVTRSEATNEQGYTWTVTFISAIGNIEQLRVRSYLQGLEAGVTTDTLIQGNEIGGTFQLLFQGYKSDIISSRETAIGLRTKLLKMPNIKSVYVERNDPTENCDDGLCENGPFQSRGFIWSIYVTTNNEVNDNITPTSPTSHLSKVEGNITRFSVIDSSKLTGINVSISLDWGLIKSPNKLLSYLNLSKPFSLAWGGAGGSYGGQGGDGYSTNPTGKVYGDIKISDLLGGSGGCMFSKYPFEINAFRGTLPGRGGHGGGAIEIIAANDITIGSYGQIIVKGGDGEQTSEGGGGGGSGGSILLAAGGVVINQGILDASGGNGGFGGSDASVLKTTLGVNTGIISTENLAGGGGGGGRIAIFGQSIINSDGIMNVKGGTCGIYKVPVIETVLQLNISFYILTQGLIDKNNLVHLVSTFINQTIDTKFVNIENVTINGEYEAILDYTIIVSELVNVPLVQNSFLAASGTNLADVILNYTWIKSSRLIKINPINEIITNCNNNGNNGTLYTESTMTSLMYVRETDAAEGTKKALFFSNNETTFTSSGSAREAPFAWNGPIIPFEPSQPTRITYYSKMESISGLSQKANFGSLFTILSRGVEGLNVSSVIGVFIGDQIRHGANFGSDVDEKIYLKLKSVIDVSKSLLYYIYILF